MLFHHIDSRYTSIQQYLSDTRIDRYYAWGTEIEILALTHFTNTNVHVYQNRYGHGNVDESLEDDRSTSSVYILNIDDIHFEVVMSSHSN